MQYFTLPALSDSALARHRASSRATSARLVGDHERSSGELDAASDADETERFAR
ncbi:hypothetical protein ABZ611_13530 [Streptomyces sp. NPDC007861]|uniref:hypothetical protein n=1 Tax=Streptomyces sp. NPDC007861 TaxID=3154893 RepID=UPI0033DF1510